MKHIATFLICLIGIISVFKDWRFAGVPFKYKRQIKLVVRDGYYYWKFPYEFYSIPALDENERMVKVK